MNAVALLSPGPAVAGFTSRRVEAGGVCWHVLQTGHGPALLLLHGTASSAATLTKLATMLGSRFTVIAPDLPGHAGSTVVEGFVPSLPNVARALSRLLEVLGVTPVVVAGHSAGAAIGVEMALRGTVKPRLLVGMASALVPFGRAAAVVYGSLARTLAQHPSASRWLARRARATDVVGQVLAGTGSSLERDDVEELRALSSRAEHVAGVLAMLASWDLDPLFDSLSSLRTPLLLLAGGRDRAVPLGQQRAVLQRVPRGSLVILDDAGHYLPTERPAEVAREICRAFGEVSA
jgi:magnesium chelatase accessory protein